MEFDENLVPYEGTENTEEITAEGTQAEAEKAEETEVTEETGTVEEPEKVYTEEEFQQRLDEVLAKKIARTEGKLRKEYSRKYGNLENVLRAGTGKQSVEEMTDTFKNFYESKGITIPQEPKYSQRDVEILAQAEANEIISSGFDDVVEEADRLRNLGAENLNEREKALFVKLVDHIKTTRASRELEKIGVKKDVYNSDEFKEFSSKFNSETPITEIYKIYNQTKPQKEFKTMGSMKQGSTDKGAVKDFYSKEEAMKFTKADFDKNPALFEAVEKSMLKW